jgi:hypothetical protein
VKELGQYHSIRSNGRKRTSQLYLRRSIFGKFLALKNRPTFSMQFLSTILVVFDTASTLSRKWFPNEKNTFIYLSEGGRTGNQWRLGKWVYEKRASTHKQPNWGPRERVKLRKRTVEKVIN